MTETGCYYLVVLILFFAELGSVTGNAMFSLPSLVTREGENIEIPCLTSGDGDILTWRRGHDFSSSEFVASLNGDNSEEDHFYVAPNGTLHIFNVSQEDTWNYYCRKASKTNDCNVGVSVLVQDKQSSISIDQCQPLKDCVIFTDDSEHVSTLTCTATFVSPQTVLKWFNGDQLLPISDYEHSPDVNFTRMNISATTTASFGYQANLQCFAFDESIGKIDGMFAYVQIEKAASNTHWIIVISLLAAFLFLSIIVEFAMIVFHRRKRHYQEEASSDERVPLKTRVSKDQLAQQLNEAISRISQLKKIAEKVDPGLLIRLKDDNVKKEENISWTAFLIKKSGFDTSGVERDLEALPDVQCVLEVGELQQNSIESTSFKELLKNSVYGWNSCIVLNLEDLTVIVKSLRNICRGLYDIIEKEARKGFQVETGMTFRKLEKGTLQGGVKLSPESVVSCEGAETFIQEKAEGAIPMALEFHLTLKTDITHSSEITGFLQVLVLNDVKELPHAFGKRGCKLVDSQQCKTLIVVDGSLADGDGKVRIAKFVKKIKELREP